MNVVRNSVRPEERLIEQEFRQPGCGVTELEPDCGERTDEIGGGEGVAGSNRNQRG